ncbi:MAG: hypothetical protein ACYDAX_10005 [Desulfobacteria bacterium]
MASLLLVAVQVTSVRSRCKFGGVIFHGKADAGEQFETIADHIADHILVPDASIVDNRQIWSVQGVVPEKH